MPKYKFLCRISTFTDRFVEIRYETSTRDVVEFSGQRRSLVRTLVVRTNERTYTCTRVCSELQC
jgi:hypothetical protein